MLLSKSYRPIQDEVYDGWQPYPPKYTAIKEVKIGIENREIVSKNDDKLRLGKFEPRFSLVFLFSRSDFAVFSTDDSALSENTKDKYLSNYTR